MRGNFSRRFGPFYERIRRDIFAFAREGLRFEPTWQQAQAMQIVQDETYLPIDQRKKRLAIKSGQGTGKSTCAVVIAYWRALQDVDALCVVTAPSMRQCTDVFMGEGRRLLERADPMLKRFFNVMNTRVEIAGRRTWGVWSATASRPENLQGYHQERLTFVVDEASGVPASIIEQIKGTLSNPDSLLFMIGNPNNTSGEFYKAFTSDRDRWHTLTFNSEDTARDYPEILHPSRNKVFEMDYGKDSDPFRIRVLGEFPRQGASSIMSLEDLEARTKLSVLGCAQLTEVLPWAHAFGIDFARFGPDESVIVRRSGLAVMDLEILVQTDPRQVVDRAYLMQRDAGWGHKACWFIADADGMGQGIVHAFHEAGRQTYEFHSAGRPSDSSQFADQISEAWFNLRTLVRERIVRLPADQRLLQQLSTRQFYTDRKGRIKVETKDEWRKRLEIAESPDRADAVVMAFYCPFGSGGQIIERAGKQRPLGESLRNR